DHEPPRLPRPSGHGRPIPAERAVQTCRIGHATGGYRLLASGAMTDETDASATPALPALPVFIGVTVDTPDRERLADFWSPLLEVDIEHRSDIEIHLARQPNRGVTVAF